VIRRRRTSRAGALRAATRTTPVGSGDSPQAADVARRQAATAAQERRPGAGVADVGLDELQAAGGHAPQEAENDAPGEGLDQGHRARVVWCETRAAPRSASVSACP
jgi:hypothetical protein